MVCAKLFSLRQRFSHFILTIEGKNFYVSVTYPQYYWKVSNALRGYLEKFFIVLLIQLETFTVILRIFRKRKNAPHLYRTFDDEFYKGFHKYNPLQVKIIEINNNFKKISINSYFSIDIPNSM